MSWILHHLAFFSVEDRNASNKEGTCQKELEITISRETQ
jgi:hypothetical protein